MSSKKTGIVKFTLNPNKPPTLTPKQRTRLISLGDEKIDFTDIVPILGVDWKRPLT